METTAVAVLAALTITGAAFAGSTEAKQCVTQTSASSFFKDQECQLDLFYSYNDGISGGDHYFHDQTVAARV